MSEEWGVTDQGGRLSPGLAYAGEPTIGPFVLSLESGVLILLGALVSREF